MKTDRVEPMKFIGWRRGMEHEWPSLTPDDPRHALFWKDREASYITVIPIAPEDQLKSIDDLILMNAYRCPPYKTIAQE